MTFMMIISLVLLGLMLLVCWYDSTRYVIPNWLNLLLVVLYPAYVIFAPIDVDWQSGLLAFALTFVVGYGLFTLRWMGGGDVKLFAACALWTGMGKLLPFVIAVGLVGGLLALALIIFRRIIGLLAPKTWNIPKIFRSRAPVPYGIAIAAGFIYILLKGGIVGLNPLA